MKKVMFFLGIVALFSGCTIKTYNKTISYPDEKIQTTHHTVNANGVWCGFRGCDYNYYYSYANGCNCDDVFCDCECPNGMSVQDDLGW